MTLIWALLVFCLAIATACIVLFYGLQLVWEAIKWFFSRVRDFVWFLIASPKDQPRERVRVSVRFFPSFSDESKWIARLEIADVGRGSKRPHDIFEIEIPPMSQQEVIDKDFGLHKFMIPLELLRYGYFITLGQDCKAQRDESGTVLQYEFPAANVTLRSNVEQVTRRMIWQGRRETIETWLRSIGSSSARRIEKDIGRLPRVLSIERGQEVIEPPSEGPWPGGTTTLYDPETALDLWIEYQERNGKAK